MTALDYIKDGDGQTVRINRAGIRMVERAIIEHGGAENLAEVSGLHFNTIYKIKNTGMCSPDSWNTIYSFMTSKVA